jgi:UDP-3-O-[3-hydroxymyristoyl] glucosamine N-acyltransferase
VVDHYIQHRAHQAPQALTLGVLAEKTGAKLRGSPDVLITGVGTLAEAQKGQISFLANQKYANYLQSTQASAIILSEADSHATALPSLISADPKLTFAHIMHLLYPFGRLKAGCHPTAVVGQSSEIDPKAYIGPHCVIGEDVKIAANVILQAHCYVGDGVEIEEGTLCYPHVTIYHGCRIGREGTIHSGAVIGSDGFGFAKSGQRWFKVPQVGGVVIGDRVEIGANTTIDRGAIENTEIGNDVILDNLIHIAHNVKIGEGTAIAASASIAGSTVVGKHCQIGGASCIVGHLSIADHVNLIGSSNVGQSITQAGTYASGLTVNDIKIWKRNLVRFHQLDEMAKRLKEVEKKLATQREV